MDITICRDCANERGVRWPLPQPPLLVLWHSSDAGVGRCLDHKSSLVCVSDKGRESAYVFTFLVTFM
jgi:hypothetical protein